SGTGLLDFMEYDSLTKAGKNIDLVYDILESPIVGESIAQDIKLISGIRVKIEKDGEWVEYPEKISIVGGTYERTVIALDRAIAGSKVRLEFLRYAYAFDYIAYDDHQTTLETAAIVPVKVLFNSKDVSAEVAETDEDYVLVHKGEEVKAYYDIKPGKKYFLAVGGYYQPLKPSEPSVDYGDLWANKDYFIKITTNMDEVRRQLVEKFTE
ncbi:MAG: hypothetical protein HGA85_07455, partial [Nanoarchaeota archaeon]|nr:hypothetical protein [Nanoarchaeota archaeon]